MPVKPVAFNETSYDVALLHKTLDVLGLKVSRTEISQQKAGADTRRKVRALQAQLKLRADKSRLLDEATLSALRTALDQRGLTAASRSFVLCGTARLDSGEVRKQQRLLAFALDLRGVAAYRTAKTIAEIAKRGGADFLGEAVSDARGAYRITFYDWQYPVTADAVAVAVFAVAADQRAAIVGRSGLVDRTDWLDNRMLDDVDVIIALADTGTEYETLIDALKTFLKQNGANLRDIASSSDQLKIVAAALDVDPDRLAIAAAAELLAQQRGTRLSHELLYGLGRQGIALDWAVLYRKPEDELREAVARSVTDRVIGAIPDGELATLLTALRDAAVRQVVDDARTGAGNMATERLSAALPDVDQRVSFLKAVSTYTGSDFETFWRKHLPEQPEFKEKPALVANLLLTQQLTALTGNHHALVRELQVTRKVRSLDQLLQFGTSEWVEVIKKTGVPAFVAGDDDDHRARVYAHRMETLLNAAFPTARIARMLERDLLPIEKTAVARGIAGFLSKNPQFDFATARIHDFKAAITQAAGNDAAEVQRELMKIQRVFQISNSPDTMVALLQNGLHSARAVASIPRKTFMKTYGGTLGEDGAFTIHQRASHLATNAEMTAVHMLEYSQGHVPLAAMDAAQQSAAMAVLQQHVPNYAALFGSPDICECEHCRSVYSPAAYFVELLRFLEHGVPNAAGQSPLDVLATRRPDLLHLPLTCENTNTIIPYIDLANEVMEYYTAHGSLANFKGYDTGRITAEELRANPQNVNVEAYRKLKDAKYPFTLPYHQPLDVIRTYSDHLQISRYDAMKAMNPELEAAVAQALAAESLRISEEAHKVLTGTDFDGNADTSALHEYFGYASSNDLENLRRVPELLDRSGLAYADLVALVQTQFINPFQRLLDFLAKIFGETAINGNALYTRLTEIATGTLNPATDAVITAALTAYNTAHGAHLAPVDFGTWVTAHLDQIQEVITLHEPDSRCDLETTTLRTLRSIYQGDATSGLGDHHWSRIHRFIRLWRTLGWTLHETDLMLAALGETDISAGTVRNLHAIVRLKAATRLAVDQLAVLWGNIDARGDTSLYTRLFLDKAHQIDAAFQADTWSDYLQDSDAVLAEHRPAILAAFRIRDNDLAAILAVARVIDDGHPRRLDLDTDILNIANVSTIYRYVVLARALSLNVADLCKLMAIFDISPFSIWDVQQQRFTNIAPDKTYEFYRLAESTKATGFNASLLDYIVHGASAPDAAIGLAPAKVIQTAKAIRRAFNAIEQHHQDAPPSPLTSEILSAKLALTFQPEIAARLIEILSGVASFEAFASANLAITIPSPLSSKCTYVKGSGRLRCDGVLTNDELDTLKAVSNDQTFQAAAQSLYDAPATFLTRHFDAILAGSADATATLLDRPAQFTAASLEDKLTYFYERFIPVLKDRLRREAITQHIAALIRLNEEATGLLIAPDIDALAAQLSRGGFSATYFSDPGWTTSAAQRTESAVDFAWGADAPDAALPADNFSARWEAYLAAPSSGEYTIAVDVNEADEAFKLSLDGTVILEKAAGDARPSWEAIATLHAARMHRLRLDYVEASQNARVSLRWKRATMAFEVIKGSPVYPAADLDAFIMLATTYHRAARFITGFELTETELGHLIAFSADFDHINFKALMPTHWRRVHDYVTLRNAVPQAHALLTEVFRLAHASPAPTIEQLRKRLHQATAWDEVSLQFLVDAFALAIGDFKNEVQLNRLRVVMQHVARTGLSAETISRWGRAERDFDKLQETAQLIKNAVKAKHEDQDWRKFAAHLSDQLRGHQQQALISYLLTQPAIKEWKATDADRLFEFFLIDVQMGSCMDTSRIVQANASLQMFVNRCLLNRESHPPTAEPGVSPDAIDQDRWAWMKNYRLWEANRKVFLYPENWLAPERRIGRSAFFKDLESYLMQNDITDRSVEQAFRNYLASMNEVANLEVCGLHKDDGGILHVVARTHNAPYKFFHRRWNTAKKWTAWEKIPVDIRSVEAGDDSGVHVMPIVWKQRLFLFWPEFTVTEEQPASNGGQSVKQVSDDKMSVLASRKRWDIRLAWSENVDGKWIPKQLTKETLTRRIGALSPSEARIRWIYDIDTDQTLNVVAHIQVRKIHEAWIEIGGFRLTDISAPVVALPGPDGVSAATKAIDNEWSGYNVSFMNFANNGPLALADDRYLKATRKHKVLVTPTRANYVPVLQDEFFFSDVERTYFVRPVDIKVIDQIRTPGHYKPYRPALTAGTINADAIKTGPSTAYTSSAFGGREADGFGRRKTERRNDSGLEFHTFYHPHSSEFVATLNQLGIDGLMQADTDIGSDHGGTFERVYRPVFTQGFVQKPADFSERTYYKENVCFDVFGANSIYNWELFFHAPLYIATRLSQNGRFADALKWFHYIFDPTTNAVPAPGEFESSRYWKVPPFKTAPKQSLEDWFRQNLSPTSSQTAANAVVAEWRQNPFDAHLVASNRPLAYMKHVVLKYVENLIAWGDFLFRQFTMESVNEALQIYIIANHILGRRPEFVPKRGNITAHSYDTLKDKWDDFSNALVELENIFPYSSESSISESSAGAGLLGVGSALYFCIPANDQLIKCWDTVADRLYKIRHCRDIDGVERKLGLFSPAIDPGALAQAAAQGLSIGSILADLSSPPPIYRFSVLIQKAAEFCADVKGLGSAVQAALEKKDADELDRLRASHEIQMLELMTAIRDRQVLDAKATEQQLQKARDMASFRLQHYIDLLGNDSVVVPPPPMIDATLTATSALPPDTMIPTIDTDVDEALADSSESGIKLITREAWELTLSQLSSDDLIASSDAEILSGFLGLIPQFEGKASPLGVGAGNGFGGRQLSWFAGAMAKKYSTSSQLNSLAAAQSAKIASYIRREQDWTLQANLAAREIVQLDKQITAADIRIQVAEKELSNHKQQIENAEAVEQFLKSKFTNQELYQWMKEQLLAVYKQSYNLAFELAKKAEKAYRLELGSEAADFIQYGHWDNSTQGLTAGDKLQLALRQLERSYLEENRRELELSKSVSLSRINPLALIELRERGRCEISLPEELFDFDFPGHYFRRIRSVRMTIPCVAGPYTSVNCTLRLLSNSIRLNTSRSLVSDGYEHDHEGGVLIDDPRFRANLVPVNAIATSQTQNDSGLFEFSFRDERYLPFEYAGAISKWQIELSTEKDLRQFDYATISDVILHLGYTAREGGMAFKADATAHLKQVFENEAGTHPPLLQMFSMRHEFPTEWHEFFHPDAVGAEQILDITLGKQRFPFFAQHRNLVVMKVEVLARCTPPGSYQTVLSYMDSDSDTTTSGELTMPPNAQYGGLNTITIDTAGTGLDLSEMDISKPMTLKLKRTSATDYAHLTTSPPEVADMFLIIHYRLEDD